MAPAKNRPVFNQALLPEGKKRWGTFGAGLGLQCLAVTFLVIAPLLFPQKFEAAQHYWITPIEAPVIEVWKPQPPPKPKPVVVKKVIVKEPPKPEVVELPKPKIYNPVFTTPVVKKAPAKKVQAPDMAEVAKEFPNQSLGSSAIPNLKKPKEQVQTGGFGDPNGVPTNKKIGNPNIAQLGGYDMPTGPGVGNGTGGAKGARGVVASTGFGNGVAVGGPSGGHGTVQQGLFGDEKAVAAPKVRQTAAVSNAKPVEILSVPKPVYTEEGRAKKVEGVVLLQVVFTASGDVKVEKVVQGLGYGLDDAAAAAARQIRFRPAQQDGQPVDFTATARIVFQLAY
ncbi:MAG TPA: energy transducer TonB [Candidatus Acidoferrales bacterium]|nr:energy transducer TonB [Candidatus Acidoferrales bacterium]